MQGGWTALTWASYKNRVEVAKILLETGANPNTTGLVKMEKLINCLSTYEISTYNPNLIYAIIDLSYISCGCL